MVRIYLFWIFCHQSVTHKHKCHQMPKLQTDRLGAFVQCDGKRDAWGGSLTDVSESGTDGLGDSLLGSVGARGRTSRMTSPFLVRTTTHMPVT